MNALQICQGRILLVMQTNRLLRLRKISAVFINNFTATAAGLQYLVSIVFKMKCYREIKSLNRNLRHSFSYSKRNYFILITFIKRISNARVFLHAQLQLSVQALANVFVVFIRDVHRVATPDFPKILLGVTYNACSMNSAAVNTTSPAIMSVSQLSLVNRYHPAVLWARNPGGWV